MVRNLRFPLSVAFIILTFSAGCKSSRTPEQPIPFTHQVHVQKLKMECMYCHSFADRSIVAGLPSVQKCMGCHKFAGLDKPGVQKLQEYWKSQKPIVWNKVHDLPDFVYFSHKRHIKAGIKCSQCHGDVGNMTVATRVSSLGMGWCLNCHIKKGAPRDCWTCHK